MKKKKADAIASLINTMVVAEIMYRDTTDRAMSDVWWFDKHWAIVCLADDYGIILPSIDVARGVVARLGPEMDYIAP